MQPKHNSKPKPLEILVVEDEEANIAVAKIMQPTDMTFTFVSTYDSARKEIESGRYAGAIIDLHFPQRKGLRPERLGFELGRLAFPAHATPYVIFTGLMHHGTKPLIIDDERGLGMTTTIPLYADKTTRYAWGEAISMLREKPLLSTWAARERFLKYTGKVARFPEFLPE